MQAATNFYYHTQTQSPLRNRLEAVKNYPYSRFYFHEKEFSAVDWSIEPTESLNQLYKKRAQQLRDQYDYLILCFSGGADSTNVLESFYYNGIHLDEILTVGALSQDQCFGDDTNHNGELYYNVFPIFNKLKFSNTKLTVMDYTKYYDNIENFSLITNYQSDWIYEIGAYLSPHTLFWRDLKKFIGQNNDKKTAVIFGADKPFIHFDKQLNKYYAIMYDSSFTQYGNFQKQDNFKKVNFYNSPDSIDLMKKQFHIVKQFLQLSMPYYDHIQKNYENIIPKIIYDLKHPPNFKSKKSPYRFLSLRDTFILDKKTSDVYNIYKDGIKKVLEAGITDQQLRPAITTRRYYI